MNSTDRLELDAIRDEHIRLRQSVDSLNLRIDLLGHRLETTALTGVEAIRPGTPPPLPKAPLQHHAVPQEILSVPTPISSPEPLRIALSRPTHASAAAHTAVADERGAGGSSSAQKPSGETPARRTAGVDTGARTASEPFELRVGTYWMPRIGIVILLTGLVFLGNYAYHLIVPLLGPWGKLSLLTLAGVGLAGLGAWLERSRETLRNYGRVLMAGGAATIYYTAYAAHFVERLRVIESPILGGMLLLRWLAALSGMQTESDRRRWPCLRCCSRITRPR